MAIKNTPLVLALKTAIAVMPRPDHTGQITGMGAVVPLDRNDCACPVHTGFVKLHELLANAESGVLVSF